MSYFEECFDAAAEAAARLNHVVDGDYEEGGLMYCGKCHTPKQVKVYLIDEERIVSCMCKCRAAMNAAEREKAAEKERKKRIADKRRRLLPEKDMRSWTFANDDGKNSEIYITAKAYVDRFREFEKNGKGLLFFGDCGRGKTYTACQIANALIDREISARVTSFARILSDLQGNFDRQEYIDELCNCSLLVIDDLGVERDTSFAKEQVFSVIDTRYAQKRPMIITTNLSREKLYKAEDITERRIYERILSRCLPIEFKGENRRRVALKDEYAEMKKMLGMEG